MQPDAGLDAPRPPPQTPLHVHKNELTLCGLAAVQARWQRDPAAIKRLFFDEATGRRIGTICRALAATVGELRSRLAMPTLLVSHDIDDIATLADRIAVLEDGRIAQIGPTSEVIAHPVSESVAELVGR